MEPLEGPLALDEVSLASLLQRQDQFVIYTHSARTRMLSLSMFLSYTVFFFMFVNFLVDKIAQHRQVPVRFLMADQGDPFSWLYYAVALLALLITLGIFLYFIWAVFDIWGLQIWVSPLQLRVQNTILGPVMARWSGIGSFDMAEIESLQGGKYFTYVAGGGRRVRFSPVYRLDTLITTILANAPGVKILS